MNKRTEETTEKAEKVGEKAYLYKGFRINYQERRKQIFRGGNRIAIGFRVEKGWKINGTKKDGSFYYSINLHRSLKKAMEDVDYIINK